MPPPRPNLENIDDEVRAYIEYLETTLESLQDEGGQSRAAPSSDPSETVTTRSVVTISQQGTIKRTPRHLYSRQRRGGMGVFDLESAENDPPALLAIPDIGERLLIFSDRNRLFPLRVAEIPESPVRARGQALSQWFPFQPGERPTVVIPDSGGTYLYLLSDRGWVRRIAGSQLSRLAAGTAVEVRPGHKPVAACWGNGDRDLVVVTRSGQAIRFEEKQVPIQGGCLGIRLDGSDDALGIAPVSDDSSVFLLSDDGKGTIRQMSGFRANKSPGSGGKTIMKADRLVDVHQVSAQDDIFIISRLSKLIRFSADEVPPKEGVVQGVNCINLRADEAVAFAISDAGTPI